VKELAILYRELRNLRLDKQHEVDELTAREAEAKRGLIAALVDAGMDGLVAEGYQYALETKVVYSPVDWSALYAFIRSTDAFDLLNRALNQAAVRHRIDDGIAVPGISNVDVINLSMRKAK